MQNKIVLTITAKNFYLRRFINTNKEFEEVKDLINDLEIEE